MITAPIFTTSLTSGEVDVYKAAEYISLHNSRELPRLVNLQKYYNGLHPVLSRTKRDSSLSNNRVVINHAAYISNFSSAYLLGQPVSYTAPYNSDISALTDALKKADSTTQDADLALDCSIFGRAYDMVYMSSDEQPYPKLARLSPLNTFVVYDDTVEQNPVFAVYYYPVFNAQGNLEKYKCSMQTDRLIYDFEMTSHFAVSVVQEPVEHYFGAVPINEIYNNGQRGGDFEQVISLIDAYNLLQSDRINDKEQFVNAILLVKGVSFGDDNAEKIDNYNALRENGVLEIPAEGADASYLTRQFDESSVEVLKNSILNDIHKISCVPDMTDQNFAANASGVAMKYKLLGLEQLTKTKERYFAEGLRYRLQLFANVLGVGKSVEVGNIDISFKRSLPANELEIAQTVTQLKDIVPSDLLLSQIPFVTDVDAALKNLKKEKQDAVKAQQAMFANTPIVNAGDSNGGENE